MATRRRPRQQRFPDAAEGAFVALILRLLRRAIRRLFMRELIEDLPSFYSVTIVKFADGTSGFTGKNATVAQTRALDAKLRKIKKRLDQVFDAKPTVTTIGGRGRAAARFNQREVTTTLTVRGGVVPKVAPPGIERTEINRWIRRNTKLIKGMTTEELAKVRRVIRDGQRAGRTVQDMQGQIQRRLQVIESRAKLIASDQIGKLDAAMTRAHHLANGIDEYTWRTVGDSEVRPTHEALNGTRQKHNSPPVTNESGDTHDPGEDINCRCRAEPIIPPQPARSAARRRRPARAA